MNINNPPLVSICCLTFNHERCIRQTLEGFLAQQANFRFEILIHDDASSDKTQEIIREYENRYPESFKTILQSENQYSRGIRGITARFLFPIAQGKYIALCEGDDYWTDPEKLKMQVDFMESHPEYGLVHTDADFFFESKNKLVESFKKVTGVYVPEGDVYEPLLRNNFIYTLTICFRKDILQNDYRFLTDGRFAFADYPLLLELASKTKFHYINKSMAVYRRSDDSMSHFDDFGRYLRFEKAVLGMRQHFLEKHPVHGISSEGLEKIFHSQMVSHAFLLNQKANAREYIQKIDIDSFNLRMKWLIIQIPFLFGLFNRIRRFFVHR